MIRRNLGSPILDCWTAGLWRHSRRQARIVRQNRIDADENRIRTLPQFHSVRAGLFAGDPFGFAACRGDFSVQRHRRFHRDERRAVDNPMIERFVQLRALAAQNSVDDFNSRAPQNLETLARVFRIRVSRADDNLFYSGGDDGVRAGRRAAVRAARFERDVKCRAAADRGRAFARRGAPRFPRAASPRADASRAR